MGVADKFDLSRALLIVLVLNATAVTAAAPPKIALAADRGLRIKQANFLLGETTILCTKTKLKVTNSVSHVTSVATAPRWQLVQYNTDTHTYCEPRLQNVRPIMVKLLSICLGSSFSAAPMAPNKNIAVSGVPALLLKSTKQYADQQTAACQSRQIKSNNPREIFIAVTKIPELPQQAGSIVCRLYGLPISPGIPLESFYNDIDGDFHKIMHTSLIKEETFKSDEFTVPTGFSKVAESQALYTDASRDADLSDFLQEPTLRGTRSAK